MVQRREPILHRLYRKIRTFCQHMLRKHTNLWFQHSLLDIHPLRPFEPSPLRSGPAPRVYPTPAVTIDSHVFSTYVYKIFKAVCALLCCPFQLVSISRIDVFWGEKGSKTLKITFFARPGARARICVTNTEHKLKDATIGWCACCVKKIFFRVPSNSRAG